MVDNVEEVRLGVAHIWNNRFDEAVALFASKPDNARFAMHRAEAVFLKSFITAETNDTEAAVEALKSARALAEKLVATLEHQTSARPSDVALANKLLDARIVYGDTLYMTAILQMTRDSKIKGAFNIRKSWKSFERALKDSKSLGDNVDVEIQRMLQFGAGFFLFAMSIIPPKFLRLVELAGFKADRDRGLEYVRSCHDFGGIRAPFATMLLLFNNLLLPRGLLDVSVYLQEAESLVTDSLAKYPTGSLFQVMGSHSARKREDIATGIKRMEEALGNCKSFQRPPLIYQYELANCYCMQLDWQRAAEWYEPLLKEAKFQVRAFGCLQLAAAYHMLGQRDKAMSMLGQVPAMVTKKSFVDSIVVRQSKRFLANGASFAAFELLYVRRDLAKMRPVMDECLRLLEQLAASLKANEAKQVPKAPQPANFAGKAARFGSKLTAFASSIAKGKPDAVDYSFDNRASYLLLKGSMLKAQGRADEAVNCYREMLSLEEGLVEKFYVPYCLYELGEIIYHQNNVKEAAEIFKQCSKHSGYDWEDPLRIRLRLTMDQLKKGLTPGLGVSVENLTLDEDDVAAEDLKAELDKDDRRELCVSDDSSDSGRASPVFPVQEGLPSMQ
eukprot:TRINITY_DN2716_c0_g1_i1.p1 TRINITY_DN2716_c0_g1~~TRINITY_DN2716_c0_g1_i1.p1  ORF type:complete len:659 (+),score=200.86 TRINITY_DN2716_c0_g1_i1:136-1977(+)